MLCLDGGGVRGALSIAFLQKLECVLESIEGRPVLLGDWFDLVGGTSTGAIIATAVALGYRAAEIKSFYEDLGPDVFRRSRLRLVGRHSLFRAERLRRKLTDILGTRTLDSEDVRTGLCIITKRLDTGSAWILLNNPRSSYWNTPAEKSFVGNRHFLLSALVRASTAAPNYFDPEFIQIAPGMAPGLFIDGGVSPHNNPSLYMLLATTLPSFGIGWALGPENLTIVSIGTGSYRTSVEFNQLPWLKAFGVAFHALQGQISDAEELILTIMSWLGETSTRWVINSELGDVGHVPPPFDRPWFKFVRYNVRLEQKWLGSAMSRAFSLATLDSLRDLTAASNMKTLYDLGLAAAEEQIKTEHFQSLAR